MLPMAAVAAFANVFRILPPGDLLATCPPTHTRPSVAPSRTRLGFHLQRGVRNGTARAKWPRGEGGKQSDTGAMKTQRGKGGRDGRSSPPT